ncbi:hypothetical protein DJ82_02430 [Halorubrum sp. Ib24]|uniref:DUF4382 domain-containing protein n=1 Tax=Halorubrum sp. Ib24 TaxID=1383850 RepID=UPI000B99D113|nr:DUF4382 domain-containing protein [Halorubrum sp. Ib24]OYR42463.1 hypothetical protein DJ82_02430 [Halorubrum sp. Ib24]
MTDRPRTTGDDRSQDTPADGFGRREFVALGAGASATLLAGCAGDGALPSSDGSDGSEGSDGSDGSQTLTGNFRLLISDAPADIGDFDQLNVTLDEARIFEARDEDDDEDDDDEDAEPDEQETDGEDDGSEEAGNATEAENDSSNGTADEDDVEGDAEDDVEGDAEDDGEGDAEDDGNEDEEDDEDGDAEERGFTVVDLDGATVDLTRVIEEDAMAVFDGEIPAGSYEKIELSVSAVEGIVDGGEVDVKLPSEKLRITNGFEVTPDEPVSFVFDINVVKRGPNNGYILKPVISGSGVAGRDVDVNEIDDDDDEDESAADAEEADWSDGDEDESAADTEEADGSDGDEDGSDGDGAAENETDGAGNETAAGSDS